MAIMLALPRVGMMKTTIIVVPPQEVEGRDDQYICWPYLEDGW